MVKLTETERIENDRLQRCLEHGMALFKITDIE